jgi:hypothetical protein
MSVSEERQLLKNESSFLFVDRLGQSKLRIAELSFSRAIRLP